MNGDNRIVANKKYSITGNYDKENKKINLWENGIKKSLSGIQGEIRAPQNQTIMALGTNPNASGASRKLFKWKNLFC